MNASIETVLAVVTFISSAVALFFSIKKQDREGKNIDADTIGKLYDTINEQQDRYEKLKRETIDEQDARYRKVKLEYDQRNESLRKEFEEYKRTMNSQFALLVHENARLRAWAEKLVKQLEEAQIIPLKFE